MTSDLQELQAYDAETMSPEVTASILSMLKKRKDESQTNIGTNTNQFQTDLDVIIPCGIIANYPATVINPYGIITKTQNSEGNFRPAEHVIPIFR